MIKYIVPEIIILVFATISLFLGFKVRDEKLIRYISAIGIIVAGISLSLLKPMDELILGGIYSFDNYSKIFKYIFLLLTFFVVLTSKGIRNPGEYNFLVLLSLSGMMFLASARDLLFLYVSLETATLPTIVLAAFNRDKISAETGIKYFTVAAISSGLLLFGISLIYGATGTLNLYKISISSIKELALLGGIFILAGLAFKMAIFPFHMWAPDVYQGAPTPVSAFLSAISKKMAFLVAFVIFYLALVNYISYWNIIFAILAVITMTIGNLAALDQTNVKRLLAYSSIGHAGYLLIGLAIKSPLAIVAAILHIITHGIAKVIAFISSYKVGDYLDDFKGLYKREPILAIATIVALLSLIGVPPLGGFFSKLYLVIAAIQGGLIGIVLALFLIINSAISIFYYAKIILNIISEEEVKKAEDYSIAIPLLILAIILVIFLPLLPMMIEYIRESVIALFKF